MIEVKGESDKDEGCDESDDRGEAIDEGIATHWRLLLFKVG